MKNSFIQIGSQRCYGSSLLFHNHYANSLHARQRHISQNKILQLCKFARALSIVPYYSFKQSVFIEEFIHLNQKPIGAMVWELHSFHDHHVDNTCERWVLPIEAYEAPMKRLYNQLKLRLPVQVKRFMSSLTEDLTVTVSLEA